MSEQVRMTDTPPPDMTSAESRVAHLRNWVDQYTAEINRLTMERDALWQAIAVLDPDAEVRASTTLATSAPVLPPEGANTVTMPAESPTPTTKPKVKRKAAPTAQRSNQSRPPLEEIAAVYNAAKAAGKATVTAMAEHFGVPVSTTNNWPSALRKAGLIDVGATVTQISSAPSAARIAKPKRDWVEIAANIIRFRDQGVSVQAAITELYGVPTSTAKDWMKHCRETGLVKPLEAGLKVLEDNTGHRNGDAVYIGGDVANAYRDGVRLGKRPVQYVADTFEIDKAVAQAWVNRARVDGFLPPAGDPQLPDAERAELLSAVPSSGHSIGVPS